MIPKFPEGERFHYIMPDGATTSFDVYDPHEKGKEGRGIEYKNLYWFFLTDWKFSHNGNSLALQGLPSDAEQLSWVTEFSVCITYPFCDYCI